MNHILSYYQAISDGSIIAGKWIKLLYKMIVEGLENKSFFYDQKAADRAIKFIERFCRHHEGALAPQRIKLEPWQKALVSLIFGIKDESGARQFREIFIVIARKQGKTLLAAAISLYAAYLDGEYGGRIYFAAPKLEQANLCFDAFYQMTQKEPELSRLATKRRTDIYIPSSNTSIKSLAFSSKKSDGLNISLGICDEVASWSGSQGIKYYEVLKSSMGARRQPLLISISTAGYENEGVYDELVKRATRVLLGDSKETRFLPVLYMIDDVDKWNDINELQKSNPNLGVSVSVDYLLEEISIAEGSLSRKAEFICKMCNIKQNASTAWLSAQTVGAACGEHLFIEDFEDSYCVLGVDLSQTRDLTAAVVVIERFGELYVFAKFFLPAERIDEATERDGLPYRAYIQRGLLQPSGENYINYHDVYDWCISLIEKHRIFPLKCGYDRYSAQYFVQDMQKYGFHCDDVYQGENLYPVMQELGGLLDDRKIHIGDNDLLKIHLLNSAIKMSNERGRGRLVKVNSTAHIDGTAALLDAMTVRQKWWNEIGAQLQNA